MTGAVALYAAAFTVAALHAVAPDHWIPFAAVARARGWSAGRTARVTVLCGLGHVTVSAVLGALAIAFGTQLFERLGSRLESVAGLLLITFGVLYGLWGLRNALGHRLHGHRHDHYDHVHAPEAATTWSLLVLFSLDACVALIPIMVAAWAFGPAATLAVVAIYEVATIGTMVALVLPARSGARVLRARWLDRFGDAVAGAVVAGVGVAVALFGW